MAETNWRELCRKLVQHAATAQLVLVGEGLWDGDEDDGLLERARAAIEADELAVIEHIIGADVVTARIESSTPSSYRLARRNGVLILQGAFRWQEGSDDGWIWRDIPTVELEDADV